MTTTEQMKTHAVDVNAGQETQITLSAGHFPGESQTEEYKIIIQGDAPGVKWHEIGLSARQACQFIYAWSNALQINLP